MDFLLDPGVTFLNHGSYGACPAPVFARYQELQRELERNPVEFLARRFDELTAGSRAALAVFLGARPDDLVFVPNATAGLNAVIRSLRLEPGDEVLTTRHEYGAVTRTWEFMGASLVYAEPEELVDAIGPRTRAVSVSHITSPTALVLPVAEICAAARAAGRSRSSTAPTRPVSSRSISRRSARTSMPATATSGSARRRGRGSSGHGPSTSAGSSRS